MSDEPKKTPSIFFDKTGRRARYTRASAITLALLTGLTALTISILVYLTPPTLTGREPSALKEAPGDAAASFAARPQEVTPLRPATNRAPDAATSAAAMRIGLFSHSALSIASLKEHARQLDAVVPIGVEWKPDISAAPVVDREGRDAIVWIRRNASHLKIFPVLQANAGASAIARAMASESDRANLVKALASLLDDNRLDGLTLDLHEFDVRTFANLYRFIDELRTTLGVKDRKLVLIGSQSTPAAWIRTFAGVADLLIYRLYNLAPPSSPTAPAPQGMVEEQIRLASAIVPREKLGFSIASFGYEWRNTGLTRQISIQSAWNELSRPDAKFTFDPVSLAGSINGVDSDGTQTRIWISDAVSGFNAARAAFAAGPAAIAVCCLGLEDAGVWSFAGRNRAPDKQALDALRTPLAGFSSTQKFPAVFIDFHQRSPGERTLVFDERLGLVTQQTLVAAPSGVIKTAWPMTERNAVALTFDDGPSPEYTPKILDILKARGVKATFYILGVNATAHPDLLRRIYDEGHDIGNHSYSHQPLTAGRERAFTELNATQRTIEGALGVRTKLFRPPYMTPYSAIERDMETLYVAAELGYVVAGYDVETFDSLASHQQIRRAAVDGVTGGGRIVLMHDAGGNRNPTIEALPHIIDDLSARGFRFTTTHELAGWTREQVMPSVETSGILSRAALLASSAALTLWSYLPQIALATAGLGIARLILIVIGAFVHRRRASRLPDGRSTLAHESVEVLVPAYNEEKVICSTVQTLLDSTVGDRISVLVIDDGSSDRTSDVVRERYGDDPRVRVIAKPNGGKSAALNFGIDLCKADIIVAIDGDTMLAPDAIELLLARFEDSRVGAVAGNVVVGNEINLITRFQSLEYLCAQNLDRRAMEVAGAIGVVPGAIGAWRRKALVEGGGYSHETLAEDADLTIAIQRLGWRVVAEPRALAYTEAPETLAAFLKQRRRWTFGTLQVAYKHIGALFGRPSGVGLVTIPNIIVFQFAFTMFAALMDVLLLIVLATWALGANSGSLGLVALYWAIFQAVDVAAVAVALWMNGDPRKLWMLWLVPVQRFTYRQLLYLVTIGSLKSAVMGSLVGWGKLLRTGTVKPADGART